MRVGGRHKRIECHVISFSMYAVALHIPIDDTKIQNPLDQIPGCLQVLLPSAYSAVRERACLLGRSFLAGVS
jgi:hypothetical protein